MKTKTNLKLTTFFLAVIGVVLLPLNYANAQDTRKIPDNSQTTQRKWIVFSPPDKSFTVELPKNPKHSDTLDPNDPNLYGMFKCTKSFDAYSISLNSKNDSIDIVVFDVSGCRRTKALFDKEAKLVAEALRPDESEIIKSSKVKINGLPAYEVIYTVEGYGRNLTVNAGKRIFMLGYGTDAKTPSKDAERIFRTFHPRRIK
ncbi:MAG: hypothetical protein ACR2N3_18140 [Pyrinomonadaceae bacterium]